MTGWLAAAAIGAGTYTAGQLAGVPWLVWAGKGWPVAVLALAVALRGRGVARLGAVGLALSAVADLVIEVSFVAGLATFLVAHLAYVVVFTAEQPRLALVRAVPFVLVVGVAASVFVPAAGELGVPVAAYALVIGAMGWRAAARAGHAPGGVIGLVGASLFILSDCLIAVDRFVVEVPWRTLAVMSTYWSAQALLAVGFTRDARGR